VIVRGPHSRTGRAPRAAGFTLIEVLVSVVLLAVIAAGSIRGLRSLAKTDVRASAVRLAGSMRYLFNRASTTGRIHRLVLDFETGKYWAETTDDTFYLPREKETEEARQLERERLARELEARQKGEVTEEMLAEQQSEAAASGGLGFGFGGGRDSDPSKYTPERYMPRAFVRKRAKWRPFKESAVKPSELKRAKFYSLFTPRLLEPMQAGQGYVYFFPLGFAEAAILHVSDETEETTYSLVVHPLTGRVKIHDRYVDPPLQGQVDDEGNLVER
jgi:prepilin-type N-terminal cleavage/methylation domain-containing protein